MDQGTLSKGQKKRLKKKLKSQEFKDLPAGNFKKLKFYSNLVEKEFKRWSGYKSKFDNVCEKMKNCNDESEKKNLFDVKSKLHKKLELSYLDYIRIYKTSLRAREQYKTDISNKN